MDNETYQLRATSTESNDFEKIFERLIGDNDKHDTIRLLHASLGLVTEAGEFADVLKKHIFYGRKIDKVNLEEELGDLFWYCAVAADALGVDFADIMQRNVDKLRKRYGEKFTAEAALRRDIPAEREILERKPAPSLPKWARSTVMWCERLPGKVDTVDGACPVHDGDACLRVNLQDDLQDDDGPAVLDERPEGREGT